MSKSRSMIGSLSMLAASASLLGERPRPPDDPAAEAVPERGCDRMLAAAASAALDEARSVGRVEARCPDGLEARSEDRAREAEVLIRRPAEGRRLSPYGFVPATISRAALAFG